MATNSLQHEPDNGPLTVALALAEGPGRLHLCSAHPRTVVWFLKFSLQAASLSYSSVLVPLKATPPLRSADLCPLCIYALLLLSTVDSDSTLSSSLLKLLSRFRLCQLSAWPIQLSAWLMAVSGCATHICWTDGLCMECVFSIHEPLINTPQEIL